MKIFSKIFRNSLRKFFQDFIESFRDSFIDCFQVLIRGFSRESLVYSLFDFSWDSFSDMSRDSFIRSFRYCFWCLFGNFFRISSTVSLFILHVFPWGDRTFLGNFSETLCYTSRNTFKNLPWFLLQISSEVFHGSPTMIFLRLPPRFS